MQQDLKILMHEEVQLLDWGESRGTGPWIKVRLSDPDLLDVFRGMDTATMKRTGHIFRCTLAEGDIAELVEQDPGGALAEDAKQQAYGKFWRDLMASGFFRSPAVLKAIGPEEDFEAWVRSQPSVIDCDQDWDEQRGEFRNEVCHVRRVSEGAGTAERPPYFAVSMTHEQHSQQHQHGESHVLATFAPEKLANSTGAEWFAKQAEAARLEWASNTLARKVAPKVASRAHVRAGDVRAWVVSNELWQYLPNRLRHDPDAKA